MTAILQPGDKIHLAIPSSGHKAEEVLEIAQKSYDFLGEEYARQGVEIVTCSANNQLTHPVVVAIFRSPDGAQ